MGNKNSGEHQISCHNATSSVYSEVPAFEVGANIQSFTAKFNDDKLHSICDYVLKESPAEIIISFSYWDQGWGNRKV
jgi:hypothetical protein